MNHRDTRALAVIVCLFTAAYSLYGLFRHWHFGSSAYDLGIFDQAVWHLSRFEVPASTINGYPNILGDHFHPIIAAWAPLYWLAPAPETLIVVQAALFAASIVPVFLFVRAPSSALRAGPSTALRAGRLSRGPAYALVVAYGLFWGLQRAAAFDVHEVAFAPLVIATAIVAMDRADWRLFWASVALLVLIKEDLIPLIGGFGLYLLIRGERRRGALAIAVSVVAFVIVVGFVVPALSPSGTYAYTSAFGDLLRRPWLLPVLLVTPIEKLLTVFLWFAPFMFLPLASPLSILIAPIAVERLLSSSPSHWGTVFHYSAPLAPILAMSAGDGLARIARWLATARGATVARRATAGIAFACVVVSAVLPGRQPLWRVFAPGHYRTAAAHVAAEGALALIPASASVVAQGAIVPHLSHRDEIFMLETDAPDAEFVVTAEHLSPWPASTFEELRTLVESRWGATHTVVFERDGWTVLRRR